MTCLINSEQGKTNQLETFFNPESNVFSPLAPKEILRVQYCKVYMWCEALNSVCIVKQVLVGSIPGSEAFNI